MAKWIIYTLFLGIASAHAKNIDSTGAMTSLSVTKKLDAYNSLTLYHYDVYSFVDRRLGNREFSSGAITSYLQAAYNYQYRPNIAFSLGYIYQRNDPFEDNFQNENRIFQQVVVTHGPQWIRYSHRLRFEERFIENRNRHETDFRTRLRYQIGAKIPLRGILIEANEFYLNIYNEFYFSTTGERHALFSDDWFYSGLGWKTEHFGNFEFGPLIQWSVVNSNRDTRTHLNAHLGWNITF